VKRTPYFQHLMDSTYKKIGTEAVKHGSDGAWERLIAKDLRRDYLEVEEATNLINGFNNVFPLLGHPNSMDAFTAASLKAAHLITSSTIQTHEQTA